MARTINGTNHFTTRDAALAYYAKQRIYSRAVDYKIEQGEIVIGKPKLAFHCSDPTVPMYRHSQVVLDCWADEDGRYMLETR